MGDPTTITLPPAAPAVVAGAAFRAAPAGAPPGAAGRETLLAAVHALAPDIRALRHEIEGRRRLPWSLVQAMSGAGLFRLLRPRSLGGLEVEPLTHLAVVEAVARADASAAWLLQTNNGGLVAAWLEEAGARAVYAADPDAIVGGTLVPRGQANAVPGGYRVSGRWPFASGVEHCAWMTVAGVVVDAQGQPALRPGGAPEIRAFFVPAGAYTILDTWSVGGLRGTGSHDILVPDVFVPRELSCVLDATARVAHPGPLYAFPAWSLGSAALAAVCLGAARGAIDALIAQAVAEPVAPPPGLKPAPAPGERTALHAQVGRAEALLGAARVYLLDAVGDAWQSVLAGRDVSPEQRARIRLAATHAGASAVQVVDLAESAAGSAALYTTSPLERAFRDVHAAVHHFNLQPWTYEAAGRTLLGLPASGPPL
jgi:alkylation response protein AidB-like acyl-CoA dehydrogenase